MMKHRRLFSGPKVAAFMKIPSIEIPIIDISELYG